MHDTHHARVARYYDTHPINEHEILVRAAAKGADLDALTEDDLKDFDQDHYGGVDATNMLAALAEIRREHRVLDVCSGLGGPARWLAYRLGCTVTGLDLTGSRVEAARRLALRVGLTPRVAFVQGAARDYLDRLRPAGFHLKRHDDVSGAWREILVARLQMYRSLRDTTVERFGLAHFEQWDRTYGAFVGLFVAGKLGGARVVARAA